jgi:hypothetical protein
VDKAFIRRYSGLLAGEIACLRGRTVFYEFAESYAPELLAGAMEELWVPIMDDDLTQPPPSYNERCWPVSESYAPELLAGAMEELWVPIMDDDLTQPPPSYNERCWPVSGRAYYLVSGETSPLYGLTNPAHSAAERRFDRISIRGAEADIKAAGRKINGVWVDALVQLLHSRESTTV